MTVALALEHETWSREVIIICDLGESFVAPLRNLKECPHPKLQRTEDGTECGLWSTARRHPPSADHFPARLLQSERDFRSDPLEDAALHDTAHTKLVSRLSQQRPLCHGNHRRGVSCSGEHRQSRSRLPSNHPKAEWRAPAALACRKRRRRRVRAGSYPTASAT